MYEINDFWKCDFIKYDAEKLQGFAFTEETRKYLVNAGLPRNHSIFESRKIKFYDATQFIDMEYQNERYTVIGESRGSKICIKGNTQEVFSISLNDKGYSVFINSNIQKFLLFHQMFFTELKNVENIDTDEVCSAFGERMREKFEKIDAKAMTDSESTWSRIVEEYETCSI